MSYEINLLPHDVRVKRTRRVYLWSIGRLLNRIYLLLILLIVGQLVILGVVMSIQSGAGQNSPSVDDGSGIINELDRVNTLIARFENRLDQYKTWTPFLEDVLEVVPADITIVALLVTDEESALLVRGVAASRSAVTLYQKQLEALPWMKMVEAPLNNFALEPDAEFSFSLYRVENDL